MKKIFLDVAGMRSREVAHKYLKNALALPDYYGENLDALYDCLGETCEPVQIVISSAVADAAHLADYGAVLLDVLRQASEENENLNIVVSE